MTIRGRESTGLEFCATAFKEIEEGLNPFSLENFKTGDGLENFLGEMHLMEVLIGLVGEMWVEFIKVCMAERKKMGNLGLERKVENGFGEEIVEL